MQSSLQIPAFEQRTFTISCYNKIARLEREIEGISLIYILTSEMKSPAFSSDSKIDYTYSITIEAVESGKKERVMLRNFTDGLEAAKNILKIFADETVMPCTAEFVLQDLQIR